MQASQTYWDRTLKQVKAYMIDQALKDANGNQCKAAKLLGRHRNSLLRDMQELGVFNTYQTGKRKEIGKVEPASLPAREA